MKYLQGSVTGNIKKPSPADASGRWSLGDAFASKLEKSWPQYDNLLVEKFAAAAAYSLRKVSVNYAGSAIRVRRSSDNAEQDIGFSGVVLDTTALTTFCGAGDGFVAKWYDQTANALHCAQSTSTAQPQIVSSGAVITDGGLPCILFDGTNDVLTAPFNVNTKLGWTVFGIFNKVGAGTNGAYAPQFGINSGPDYGALHYVKSNNTGASYPFYGTLNFYDGQGSYSNNSRYLFMFVFNSGVSWSVYKNAQLEAVVNSSTSFISLTHAGFEISSQTNAARYANQKVSEALYFDKNVFSSRSLIEHDINTYYGIY